MNVTRKPIVVAVSRWLTKAITGQLVQGKPEHFSWTRGLGDGDDAAGPNVKEFLWEELGTIAVKGGKAPTPQSLRRGLVGRL